MSASTFTLDLGDPQRAGVFFVTAEDIAVLSDVVRDAGLLARHVDLRGCTGKAGVLSRLADVLDVPEGRGRNWDAMADALRDLSWLPAPGYTLLVDDAGELRDADEASFETLLALLDEASADWATQQIPFWAFLALPEEEFEDTDG